MVPSGLLKKLVRMRWLGRGRTRITARNGRALIKDQRSPGIHVPPRCASGFPAAAFLACLIHDGAEVRLAGVAQAVA